MRIYSTKSLLFIGNNESERFKVKHHDITDAPDWIEKTTTFQLAKEDGALTLIENKEQKVAAENGDLKKLSKNKNKNE